VPLAGNIRFLLRCWVWYISVSYVLAGKPSPLLAQLLSVFPLFFTLYRLMLLYYPL